MTLIELALQCTLLGPDKAKQSVAIFLQDNVCFPCRQHKRNFTVDTKNGFITIFLDDQDEALKIKIDYTDGRDFVTLNFKELPLD